MQTREKRLLIVLLVLLVGVVYWFFLFRPIQRKVAQTEAEVNQLSGELNIIRAEYANKQELEQKIEQMKQYNEGISQYFPAFISQERIIYTIKNLEAEIESMKLTGYTMTKPEILLTQGEYVDSETGITQYQNVFSETKVAFTTNTSYPDFIKMLEYIQNHDTRLSIENLGANEALDDQSITTAMTLNFYGLSQKDRSPLAEDFFELSPPKQDNIFKPFAGYGQVQTDQTATTNKPTADFVIEIDTVYADNSSLIVYPKKDQSGTAHLYSNRKQVENLEMVFRQVEGKYYYKYKTDYTSYPTNYTGIAFAPEKAIQIEVISSARVDDKDISGVRLTVINQTDLAVNISVPIDDQDKPRFELVKQEGVVNVE